MANENAKNIARAGGVNLSTNSNIRNQQNQKQMLNPFDIAQSVLEEYSKRNGKLIQRNDLINLLQKKIRSDEVSSSIKYLLDSGFIAEEDDNHYVINY